MNSIEKKVPQKILEFLQEEKVSSKSTVIVGLSGGPDSTALLLSLCEMNDLLQLDIKAAYVNHGIRESVELSEDDLFIASLTKKLNVELYQLHISPGEIESVVLDTGRSPEEVARSYRYNFFQKIVKQFNTAYLLLGHNRDDQYETLISRFFQGSGIRGLKGIPHRNKYILRPLIYCRKSEILQYLSESNQAYRIDPSNDENDYQRNQIRNRLIPIIEEIFPGYAKSLSTQEKRFISLEKLVEVETEQLNCIYQNDSCSVLISSFNSAHEQIRLNLLYSMFDYCYMGDIEGFRVPVGFFNSLFSGQIQQDRVYAQAYGMRIFTDKKTLKFSIIDQTAKGYYYHLTKNVTEIAGKFIIEFNEKEATKIEMIQNSPLIIRSLLEGDVIEIKGKKILLKKIFKNWNVSSKDRNIIPILVDSEGIIAVLAEFLGYKNILRNKKINFGEKFNILYLGISKILQE